MVLIKCWHCCRNCKCEMPYIPDDLMVQCKSCKDCGSICIKKRTYTSGHQSIKDPLHCLFLYPVMINDRNHGCQFLCCVVFPPWNP
ncbi:hypothetical protein CY35_12G038200 [Sphagnum magellanicum]|nr:hypothetical protein CY35_12G038200 [Sphagnum magellanicum]